MKNGKVEKILQTWNLELKSKVPLEIASDEQLCFAKQSDTWRFNLYGKVIERLIIYLRSPGCTFALKTGGCTMCAHSLIGTTLGKPFASENFIKQFESEYAQKYDISKHPVLCLYNEGNMLNQTELPWDAFSQILTMIRTSGYVKRLIIDSRSEYITDKSINFVIEHLGPDIELEVGIGLESVNHFVRNTIMLKAIFLNSFERSVKLLNKYGIRSLAYVVLKPPFLDEAQAIHDTLATGKYAFEVGTNVVSVEPIGVAPYTITDSLHKANLFKPPWLWSVLTCVRELANWGEVRIGGFQFAPIPETLPRNCPHCTDRVVEKIHQYNATYDMACLEDFCEKCYNLWERELKTQDTNIDLFNLSTRIETYFRRYRDIEH